MHRTPVPRWRAVGWVSLPLVGAAGAGVLAPGGPPALLATMVIALAVALGAYANLTLRAVGEHRVARRFLSLWAGSAVVALGLAAAVAGGTLLRGPSRAGLVAAGAAATGAAAWTLSWGLAASVVTALLAPPRPPAALGGLLRSRAALADGLLLAAGLSTAALVAAAAAGPAGEPPPVPSPRPAAPSPSADPTDPALTTNPDPDPLFPGRCPGSSVSISYRTVDAAAGRRFGLLVATNTGARRCTLRGYPDVAFADARGNNVRVDLAPGSWGGVPQPVRAVRPGTRRHVPRRADLARRRGRVRPPGGDDPDRPLGRVGPLGDLGPLRPAERNRGGALALAARCLTTPRPGAVSVPAGRFPP